MLALPMTRCDAGLVQMSANTVTAQDDLTAAHRHEVLGQYAILDTAREEEFDEIAALAAAICDAPVALVSFVDVDRQWFKAEVGFGQRETPIEQSICVHALNEDELLEIPDTRLDPRSSFNTLVTGAPHVRFYAGAVMRSPDGVAIGTLCVLDTKPRKLTDVQRQTLKVLARQVVRELDLRMALRVQDVLRREIDHRVKNQLQSVASFVRLKAGRTANAATRQALSEVSHRVSAAALLHEELYSLDRGDEVGLGRYMDRLARLVAASAPENVTVDLVIEPVAVTATQASAVAAIVNEFVTNAFKHAFPDGRSGTITVRGALSDGLLTIRMADDGVGTDGPLTGNGIGMRIIDAAANQVSGRLEFDTKGPGIALTLTIPMLGGSAAAATKRPIPALC